jgi:hypothetical protein
MSFKIEEFWDRRDLLIFTSNGVVKRDGTLVMGRGIAKLVRDFYPGIDRVFGRRVKTYGNRPFIVKIEGRVSPSPRFVMSFPTKHHWRGRSSLLLIKESREKAVKELEDWRELLSREGVRRVLCPIWGTENGSLSLEDVREELQLFKEQVEELGFKVVFFSRNGVLQLEDIREV